MRELRLVLLGLAAGIAMLLGGSFLKQAFRSSSHPLVAESPPTAASRVESSGRARPPLAPSALAAARTAVERVISDVPDYSRFFDRLRLLFPSDYDAIVNGLAQANIARDINADTVMADAVAMLRRSHGALAAKSSDSTLEQIFALQLKELSALGSNDPHLCVAFLYGTNGTGFQGFAADHRSLVAEAAIAGLDAMNSGRMNQVSRDEPSDSDFRTLDHALVDKGLSRPEIDALLDGKTPDPPIADTVMCQAGQMYLQTLASLPADIKGRLYALAVGLMVKS